MAVAIQLYHKVPFMANKYKKPREFCIRVGDEILCGTWKKPTIKDKLMRFNYAAAFKSFMRRIVRKSHTFQVIANNYRRI